MRTNNKVVIDKVRDHILGSFDTDHGWDSEDRLSNLKQQVNAMVYDRHGVSEAARDMVEGGSFLVYYSDIIEFLNELNINPFNKKFTAEKSWNLYINLLSQQIVKLYYTPSEVKELTAVK